ncbi:MAG: glycosyltransferase [Candidatus Omnitrophica bacterium]|nr:glycosyltransferase [Candidatus Omnitrophota bacterium]
MKRKLIIWGGWWDKERPLSLATINSHASVSAYFLTRHLSEFYDIISINNFYSAHRILDRKDAIAVLSTFQGGFTKMSEKGRESEYKKIRREFPGKLCSIIDDTYRLNYGEDILFTVKPRRAGVSSLVRKFIGKDIVVERCGWPAAPDICFPEHIAANEINIFVDHSWYGGKLDCSRIYFKAFKAARRLLPHLNFNIYRQNNDGIVKWDLAGELEESGYLRKSKVPYLDVIKIYRKCHIFCVTHPESAGLAAVEAAMCGARLYVPSFLSRPFISRDLLADGVEYSDVKMTAGSIISALRSDIGNGINRERARQVLTKNNTWKAAASRIHSVLKDLA